MAKRNELRSLLGGLNSGNARGREDIALGDLISRDQVERFRLEPNLSACDSPSFTKRLRRNINHLGTTIRANVSDFFQKKNPPANCDHFAIGPVIVSKIVFLWLSFDHVEKKLLELFIARARPQRSHD